MIGMINKGITEMKGTEKIAMRGDIVMKETIGDKDVIGEKDHAAIPINIKEEAETIVLGHAQEAMTMIVTTENANLAMNVPMKTEGGIAENLKETNITEIEEAILQGLTPRGDIDVMGIYLVGLGLIGQYG